VGRIGKAGGRTPMMHDSRKSDGPIVPVKPSNKAEPSAAERVEGRGPAEGNMDEQNAPRAQNRIEGARSALDRVRQRARQDRKARFTTLFHHITVDRLRDAYLKLQKRAAPGVDGVTWEQYGENLEANLLDLHARLHRGAYRARPSRRVYIPKADGRQRPLGIASLEDKLVQRAVVEVLNAIYEVDFLGFSYGFRPQRSPHTALDALAVGILRKKVNWLLDADIRGFFDAIDHGWLVKFIEHRIAGDGSPPPACCIPGLTSASTFGPEARAQCGSSARWDPCGGRPEPDGAKGRPYRDQRSCIAALVSAPVEIARISRSSGSKRASKRSMRASTTPDSVRSLWVQVGLGAVGAVPRSPHLRASAGSEESSGGPAPGAPEPDEGWAIARFRAFS
jgi:hypothetical protein